MTKIFKKLTLFIATLGLVGLMSAAPAVSAIDITEKGTVKTPVLTNDKGEKIEVTIAKVISSLMFFLGIVAVIIIIIAGIRFATANGDAGKVKSARETILYAVIGLIVAIMSYVIVQFIIDRFKQA